VGDYEDTKVVPQRIEVGDLSATVMRDPGPGWTIQQGPHEVSVWAPVHGMAGWHVSWIDTDHLHRDGHACHRCGGYARSSSLAEAFDIALRWMPDRDAEVVKGTLTAAATGG
jgi:hypothetical protein